MSERAGIIAELESLVEQVPYGRVASYGQLGRLLSRPVSGLLVGRWMAQVSPQCPWWRIVAADGHLPVAKKDPSAAATQRLRLEDEGVEFDGDKVGKLYFWNP